MEVLHPRCAGLDVHNDSVVACVRLAEGGHVKGHVETFDTTTSDLERLSARLAGYGVTHVAMEATGVYWKPVWAVLCEGDFALVLANAHHVKAVPGRKTDVNDATWLAESTWREPPISPEPPHGTLLYPLRPVELLVYSRDKGRSAVNARGWAGEAMAIR